MPISIKNISGANIVWSGGLLLDGLTNAGELQNATSYNCQNTWFDIIQDPVLYAAVSADQLEVYVDAVLVPKFSMIGYMTQPNGGASLRGNVSYSPPFLIAAAFAGTNNDYALPNTNTSHFRIGGTATITGFVPISTSLAQELIFTVVSGSITFSNESVSSAAQNRMSLGASAIITTGNSLRLKYNPPTTRWIKQ